MGSMKTITSLFVKLDVFSFLVGMLFGAAIGLILFCYLVPSGPKMIGLYRGRGGRQEINNQEYFRKIYAKGRATTTDQLPVMNR